ncbi:hypothetical protein ACFX11_015427 [Malus domestica]
MALTSEWKTLTKAFSGLGVVEKALVATLGKSHPEERQPFRKTTPHFFKVDERSFERWDDHHVKLLKHEFLRFKKPKNPKLWRTPRKPKAMDSGSRNWPPIMAFNFLIILTIMPFLLAQPTTAASVSAFDSCNGVGIRLLQRRRHPTPATASSCNSLCYVVRALNREKGGAENRMGGMGNLRSDELKYGGAFEDIISKKGKGSHSFIHRCKENNRRPGQGVLHIPHLQAYWGVQISPEQPTQADPSRAPSRQTRLRFLASP